MLETDLVRLIARYALARIELEEAVRSRYPIGSRWLRICPYGGKDVPCEVTGYVADSPGMVAVKPAADGAAWPVATGSAAAVPLLVPMEESSR